MTKTKSADKEERIRFSSWRVSFFYILFITTFFILFLRSAFALCDEVLRQAVEGVSDLITTPGNINGGFYQRKKDSVEPHLVIAVDDLDEHMAMVKKEGGTIAGEPMVIQGIGRFVMIKDTEGNKVGMLQPKNM